MAFLNEQGLERLWSHIVNKLSGKVDKVDGKGLSTNDFTDAEKEKLAGIEEGATVAPVTSVNEMTGEVVVEEVERAKSLSTMEPIPELLLQDSYGYYYDYDFLCSLNVKAPDERSFCHVALEAKVQSSDRVAETFVTLQMFYKNFARKAGSNSYKIYDEGNKPYHTHTITLNATSWTQRADGSYIWSRSINWGATFDSVGHVDIYLGDNPDAATVAARLDAWSMINRASISPSTVSFSCYFGAPTIDIPVIVEVFD